MAHRLGFSSTHLGQRQWSRVLVSMLAMAGGASPALRQLVGPTSVLSFAGFSNSASGAGASPPGGHEISYSGGHEISCSDGGARFGSCGRRPVGLGVVNALDPSSPGNHLASVEFVLAGRRCCSSRGR